MTKVVLSIAAHGDDAEFKSGGTLAKMAAQGHDVYMVVATNNDRGSMRLSSEELKAIARVEAEAAAAVLGAKEVFMLGYTDGDLCDVKPSVLRGKLMHLIRRLKADIIFSWDPFAPFEDHPDHRALAWAASDAAAFAHFPLFHPEHLDAGLAPHRVTQWYWYSKADWQTNRLVDISQTMEAKLRALCAYDCQMVLTLDEYLAEARVAGVGEDKLAAINPLDYRPWVEIGMRAVHGKLGREIGVEYAEAFRYERVQVPELFRLETRV